ncbi:hypothetical protein P4O66_012574 [Electrophorus voltai]|uniref:Uncharacterized protein n=1 Tax=Electrophorus voltai TaxID=2609070 RepID=A0AAD9DRL6_9TELE|nr:hypothetical protein P4O66_012574 [Electrophorus voltai]
MRRRDSNGLFTEYSDNDCEVQRCVCACVCVSVCACACVFAHTRMCMGDRVACQPSCSYLSLSQDNSLKCNECGKNRAIITRYSEGYGTEEECVQSDAQGESDADADIEDTDSRLQDVGSLQRISLRKRKRQRIARQDTTESEDDGGWCQRTHRWSLRLSPHRPHNRTILEESISQVRPLVISRCNAVEPLAASSNEPQRGKQSLQDWPFTFSLPLFFFLIILPLSISIIIVFFVLPLSLTNT